eukprot:comp18739_c0_seq1/m.34053 comp18739_c0_seq1/g.34053  ORF comp18739_c0_seq1/g.34053 comp18739_c0_seq1/m.34053 type:complete len:216 (+) comp18739_c0_seq1:746-1393(+)
MGGLAGSVGTATTGSDDFGTDGATRTAGLVTIGFGVGRGLAGGLAYEWSLFSPDDASEDASSEALSMSSPYPPSSSSSSSSWILIPGTILGRPSSLEIPLFLPRFSTISLTVSFERLFLPWTMYPPDPHKEHDVGVSLFLFSSSIIFSNPIAVPLPLPDFSMPYNVMILTCTVYAMMFGSTLNVLLRNVSEDDKNASKPGLFAKILAKILRKKQP